MLGAPVCLYSKGAAGVCWLPVRRYEQKGAHLWDVLSSPGWVLLKYSIFLFKTIFVRERQGIFIYIFSLCHKALLYARRLEVTRQVLARMLYKGSMHFMFHANSHMQLSALCLASPALRKNNCNTGSTARLAISMYCKEFPLTSTLSGNGNSSLLSVLIILYKRWWLRWACLHPTTRGLLKCLRLEMLSVLLHLPSAQFWRGSPYSFHFCL